MENLVKTLSSNAGVYLFKNKDGNVIYIGKAKVLKKRVLSYFQKAPKDWKIQMLLEEAVTVDVIETTTEGQALLLEAELVQKYQPKFNVLLKSGQPFLYLLFTENSLEIVRTKKTKGLYCGPFINKQQARNVYEFLINTFKLYQCNKKINNGCLDYHLGKCIGTCLENFDQKEYAVR
ncbi:excinuclease ABC subunit UvrC, partial [bacterium]|nr:excinuclease ABC subunit UvrC [bacterium]